MKRKKLESDDAAHAGQVSGEKVGRWWKIVVQKISH